MNDTLRNAEPRKVECPLANEACKVIPSETIRPEFAETDQSINALIEKKYWPCTIHYIQLYTDLDSFSVHVFVVVFV